MSIHAVAISSEDSVIEDSINQFFPPAQFDTFDLLVDEHDRLKKRIVDVHSLISQEKVSGVMSYFFNGNNTDQYGRSSMLRHTSSFDEVFKLEGAINELTASFWQKALDETSLSEWMPAKRRHEWHASLNAWREQNYKRGENPELDMPEFNRDNLRSTITSLLARRPEFLAERVDGFFKRLSGKHVTNQPQGFYKRMIIANMFTSYGTTCYERKDHLHDLRLVIAKFMGRSDPDRNSTAKALDVAQIHTGQWVEIDGGALKLKAFKVGTLHLEVHPEMAWRLNSILAYLYPQALPTSATQRSKSQDAGKKIKPMSFQILPSAVCDLMLALEPHKQMTPSDCPGRGFDFVAVENALSLSVSTYVTLSEERKGELDRVLQLLGAQPVTEKRQTYWQFPFEPLDVVRLVALAGTLPDQQEHQFYPTPADIGQRAVELADIVDTDRVLEPEAGMGAIADLLPKKQTLCVELNAVCAGVLREKGHQVIEGDFMSFDPLCTFDVIVMNPPYSGQRWKSHTVKAAGHLSPGGRLVTILPKGQKRALEQALDGFHVEEFEAPAGKFLDTKISVSIYRCQH